MTGLAEDLIQITFPLKTMRIHLADFPFDTSIDVRNRYDPKELDLEFVDLIYKSPLDLEGTVERGKDSLSFQGRLVSDVEYTCGRCLKTVMKHVDQDFQLYYDVRGLDSVDTTDDLREILMLNHPIAFVCSDNCRGLCPQCGMNLNEEKCQCGPVNKTEEETPFKTVLKKLKEGRKNGTS